MTSSDENSSEEDLISNNFKPPMGKFLTCLRLLIDGSIAYGLPTLAVTRRTK